LDDAAVGLVERSELGVALLKLLGRELAHQLAVELAVGADGEGANLRFEAGQVVEVGVHGHGGQPTTTVALGVSRARAARRCRRARACTRRRQTRAPEKWW